MQKLFWLVGNARASLHRAAWLPGQHHVCPGHKAGKSVLVMDSVRTGLVNSSCCKPRRRRIPSACLPALLHAYFKHTDGVGKRRAFMPAKPASTAKPKARSPRPQRVPKKAAWLKSQGHKATLKWAVLVGCSGTREAQHGLKLFDSGQDPPLRRPVLGRPP